MSSKEYPQQSPAPYPNGPPLGFDFPPATNPTWDPNQPQGMLNSTNNQGPPDYSSQPSYHPVPMPRTNRRQDPPPPYTPPAMPSMYPQLSHQYEEEKQMPNVNPLSYIPENNMYPKQQANVNSLNYINPGLIPPGAAELYSSSGKYKIYFIQKEGYVTAPKEGLELKIFKLNPTPPQTPESQASFSGSIREAEYLLVASPAWSLGISKRRNHCIKSATAGIYGFHDTSTSPSRCVILKMPHTTTNPEIQRFDVLLNVAVSVANEPTSAVDKFETGIGGAYQSITNSVNSFVKGSVPDVHKKTKWFRKGASNIVQTGGKLISQGTHLVADPLMNKSSKGISPQHQEIIAALKIYRQASDKNEITLVSNQS